MSIASIVTRRGSMEVAFFMIGFSVGIGIGMLLGGLIYK